jgi:hypothetical protein
MKSSFWVTSLVRLSIQAWHRSLIHVLMKDLILGMAEEHNIQCAADLLRKQRMRLEVFHSIGH